MIEPDKIVLKVVYYGPALSGKTTNLMQLHERLHPQRKGELMVLETKDDRTLFFDLLPVGLRTSSGLDLRIKLYTVPGQVQHDGTRKAVLSRADGVIFVADSQPSQQENNAVAFENLAENLARVGLSITQLPVVVQFNKRDLPGVLSDEEINARWAGTPWAPVVMASALHGRGVIETLRRLLVRMYPAVDAEYTLHARHDLGLNGFLDMLGAGEEPSRAPL